MTSGPFPGNFERLVAAETLNHWCTGWPALAVRDASLPEAEGHVLAEAVHAPHPVPTRAVAMMDGVALLASRTEGAGVYSPIPLPADHYAVIRREEALPAGLDAVAGSEWLTRTPAGIEIFRPVPAGEAVLAEGGMAKSGEKLLEAGERLTAVACHWLADCGVEQVRVRTRPRVCLIGCRQTGTGAVAARLAAHLASRCGARVDVVAAMDGDELASTLRDAAADLLLVVGAAGMGVDDFAAGAIRRTGSLDFHGVALRPGQATGVGRIGEQPLVLLSGNPAGCFIGFQVVVAPLLASLQQMRPLPEIAWRLRLTRKLASPLGVEEYRPIRVERGGARPVPMIGEGGVDVLARAHGWVRIAAGSEGYDVGETVTCHWPGAVA